MKIGILTYAGALNYGAQAQLYALMNYLKDNGADITVLMFYPEKYWTKNVKIGLRVENDWYKHPKHICQSIKRMKMFSDWIKNIPNKIKVHKGEDVDALNLDLVIIGSDEIANFKHPFFNEIYIGKGIIKTPVVYYAPSAGALSPDYKLSKEETISFSNIKRYSARDMATKKFFENNTTKNVSLVLDPTFLWEFCEVKSNTILNDKYILLYSFDSLQQYEKEIVECADKSNYKIVSLAREYKWADVNLPTASEEEWITCFRKCDIVITDSFHGLVFAIKNRKKFVLISRGDKVNKNNGLLDFLGIKINYYEKGSIYNYLQYEGVDYKEIEPNIIERKYQSEKYLKEVMKTI